MPRAELNRIVLERLVSERAQLQLARENGIRSTTTVDQAEQLRAPEPGRPGRTAPSPRAGRRHARGASAGPAQPAAAVPAARPRSRCQRRVSDQEVEQFLRDQQAACNAAQVEINLAQVLIAVPENAAKRRCRHCAPRPTGRGGARVPARTSPSWRARTPTRPGAANGGQFGLRRPTAIRRCSSRRCRGARRRRQPGAFRRGLPRHQGAGAARPACRGRGVTQSHSRHILLRTTARS
jgi:peptidyl-prolyl cis-trans isomerase SurA